VAAAAAPARAVTVAAVDVVRVTRASPLPSVVADDAFRRPAVVENVTGIPWRRLPDASSTCAMICTEAPVGGTLDGSART